MGLCGNAGKGAFQPSLIIPSITPHVLPFSHHIDVLMGHANHLDLMPHCVHSDVAYLPDAACIVIISWAHEFIQPNSGLQNAASPQSAVRPCSKPGLSSGSQPKYLDKEMPQGNRSSKFADQITPSLIRTSPGLAAADCTYSAGAQVPRTEW